MPHRRKELSIRGRDLWYLVGLITSDGCLSKDGRHIDITSKDRNFLIRLVERLAIPSRIGVKNRGTYKQAYRIQIANKSFYEFLLSIGLIPNKSLTLKQIGVPEKYFADFLRGLIDGDGCIKQWLHPSNKREQWSLCIYSGSSYFMEWLRNTIEFLLKAKGKLYKEPGRAYTLKYGKMSAKHIFKECYYEGCFGLQRKIMCANNCISSYKGWDRSKTVL